MLDNQACFVASARGIEQADHDEFAEHKDVLNRINGLALPTSFE